jgi:CysZ protein
VSHTPLERYADVQRGVLPTRLMRGVHFALSSVALTLRRAELRWLALACVLVNVVVYGGLAVLGVWLLVDVGPDPEAYEGFMATAVGWVRFALRVLLVLGWLLLSIWLAMFLSSLLCGPLFDLLSERTETLLVGRTVAPPFSVGAALGSALTEMFVQLRLLLLYLPAVLAVLALNLVPIVGQIASPVAAWVLAALWVSMSFTGPVGARHGLGARDRVRLLLENVGLGTGFGAVGGLPFLSFFLLPLLSPALVVGMTRLALALATHGHVSSKLTDSDKQLLRQRAA